MQLFLVNNDPLDTLLVSQDGEPRYTIRSSIDTHPKLPESFQLSSSPDSYPYSESSSSLSSAGSLSGSSSSSSKSTLDSQSSVSSEAPSTEAVNYAPPSPHLAYRQRPAGLHPAIPITRIHSNPHPDEHKQWPDPSSPHPSPVLLPSVPSSLLVPGPSRLVTNIRRLDRHNSSNGNVETEVGRVEYSGGDVETRVQLSHLGMELCAPAVPRKTGRSSNSNSSSAPPTPPSTSASQSRTVSTVVTRGNDAGTALAAFRDFCNESQKKKESSTPSTTINEPGYYDEDEAIPDPTWSFTGPDNRPYKWISLASNPVLVNDTIPPTPIACYRPAKLGIVSRSRRGFLEILPEGLEKEDWIVATFAGYFRMRLGDRPPLSRTSIANSSIAGLPMGVGMRAAGGGGARKVASAPTIPLTAPLTHELGAPPSKLSSSPLALASLEALRRKNKDYGYGSARRTR
ncbi:hypothetical protein D9756_008875 [Leucocoprinus leucothites]|uniref:DUF6593 domain-containing protein n=1 Tax=Leucocoprinus leucothites TaxID=201217 RepID=A0A8H5CX71_9AGAR|nr:hypothetical protein D9756_008875 [Leucoagaricus leucothites]